MFGTARTTEKASALPDAHDGEEAMFTVVHAFRMLGRLSRDGTESNVHEEWAQHIGLLRPAPGQPAHNRTRAWGAARLHLEQTIETRIRGTESEVTALRETVEALTQSLVAVLNEGRASDERTTQTIEQLRAAAVKGTAEELRACAIRAVEAVSTVISEREVRSRKEMQALHERAGALQAKLTEAEREKMTDGLTGVANRRFFDSELARVTESARLHREPAALLLFDLDHFKRINDDHGHIAGDTALRTVARVLTMAFPRRTDCVARFGGEELAVLLRGTAPADALRLAARALDHIRRSETTSRDGRSFIVTASVGVAAIDGSKAPTDVLADADQALYRAKHRGRDCAVAAWS